MKRASEGKCVFCPKLVNKKEQFRMLNRALYLKYSNSYDHLLTKEIDEFVENKHKKGVIAFKDNVLIEEEEEYMTEVFEPARTKKKIEFLTEYYKFHNEIPRIFIKEVSDTMNRYHDKKRRIDYYRIKKLLKEQNGEENFSDDEEEDDDSDETSESEDETEEEPKRKAKSRILNTFLLETQKEKGGKLPQKGITPSRRKDASITLVELNSYLGDLHQSWKDISLSLLVAPQDQPQFKTMPKVVNSEAPGNSLGFSHTLLNVPSLPTSHSQQPAPPLNSNRKPVTPASLPKQNTLPKPSSTTHTNNSNPSQNYNNQKNLINKYITGVQQNNTNFIQSPKFLSQHTVTTVHSPLNPIHNKKLMQNQTPTPKQATAQKKGPYNNSAQKYTPTGGSSGRQSQQQEVNKNLDKIIGNNPNIFFNFNINKLNCPFPMEMMNQINKKLKDYQSVSKKQRNRDMQGVYKAQAKKTPSLHKANSHSDKANQLYINVIDPKDKKEEPAKARKYHSHLEEHLGPNPSLSLNQHNIQSNHSLKKGQYEFQTPYSHTTKNHKAISLNQNQLQGLLQKVSDQIHANKHSQSPAKKKSLKNTRCNSHNFENTSLNNPDTKHIKGIQSNINMLINNKLRSHSGSQAVKHPKYKSTLKESDYKAPLQKVSAQTPSYQNSQALRGDPGFGHIRSMSNLVNHSAQKPSLQQYPTKQSSSNHNLVRSSLNSNVFKSSNFSLNQLDFQQNLNLLNSLNKNHIYSNNLQSTTHSHHKKQLTQHHPNGMFSSDILKNLSKGRFDKNLNYEKRFH